MAPTDVVSQKNSRSKVAVFVELFQQARKINHQTAQLAQAQAQLKEQTRRLEQMELESRIRYRNLADAIPHIVWKAGADMTVDYFNRTWTAYTGLTLEQSCGAGWMSVFHADDLPMFMNAWREAGRMKKGFEIETRILNKADGVYRWHLIKGVPDQPVEGGEVVSWLLTCTEIHALKEIEGQLVGAKKEAEDANKAKSFFLANMSHEIRTPLSAILGFSELLFDAELRADERFSHALVIKKNGEQLLRLIDEILDISKIESNTLSLCKEKIYMRELIRAVESCLSIQAKQKNLLLDFHFAGSVPEYFYSDPTRVRQILINIVGNAVKFSGAGIVKVRLTMEPQDAGVPKLKVVVEDNGPGIDPEHIGSLFKPFSQGDGSTSRRYGGTGLGLALSRRLAQALGGDVVLESTQKGVGSRFVVTLDAPCDGAKFITGVDSRPEAGRSLPPVRPLMRNGLEQMRILVADDAPENQWLFSFFLRKAGATVAFAGDGEQVVDMALKGDYHLILMDIQMPKVDGYEATRALRAKGFKKPILAVTAHALVEEKERCLQAGCDDHLPKPVDPRVLIERIVLHCSAGAESNRH